MEEDIRFMNEAYRQAQKAQNSQGGTHCFTALGDVILLLGNQRFGDAL